MSVGFTLQRLEPVHEIVIRDLPAQPASRSRILAGLARSQDPVLMATLGPAEPDQAIRILLHDAASSDVLRRLRERARRLQATWQHRHDLAWIGLRDLPREQAVAARCLQVLETAGIEVRLVQLGLDQLQLVVTQQESARACTLLFEALGPLESEAA